MEIIVEDKCTHDHYKTDQFMQYEKAVKDTDICWTGIIEKECKDCGADIAFARRVRVMSPEQYLKSIES